MMPNKNLQSGYVALVSALIISALLLTITFSLSFSGFFTRFNILGIEFKKISGELAEACADTALVRLAENTAYAGNEVVSVGGESCIIRPLEAGVGSEKIIKTRAEYERSFTNLRVGATVNNVSSGPQPPPPQQNAICADTLVMFDRTGSMSSTDLANERVAGKLLLALYSSVSPNPKVGVGRFGDSANGGVEAEIQSPRGLLNSNYGDDDSGNDGDNDLYHAIETATGSNSSTGTNLSDAMTVASTELNSTRATPGNQKVIIIISDGDPNEPTTSPVESALDAADAAKLAGIDIFTIHFGSDPSGFLGQELLAAMASGDVATPSHAGHGGGNHELGSADDKSSASAENSDDDYFYISPTSAELEGLFFQIGTKVCPSARLPAGFSPNININSWQEVPTLP